MSHYSEMAIESQQEQENLSGAFDMEEYIHWANQYDEETLRAREAMPQPLNVANTTEKGN